MKPHSLHVVVHARGNVSDGIKDAFDETFERIHMFVALFECGVKNPARDCVLFRLDFGFRFCTQMMRHNLRVIEDFVV